VPVDTREEIGQVARAFDEVHSQAVRLATEQAQLRANVNDIFVNLSRRTQGLVERQLKLIDRLESGEQDPQQLDNLFQLDHLATRMRRNSENLLVLAGTDAANRSSRPVRLVDVLRAAVSEVEQYQRLVLQQPPAVLVLGRSASDLVHLLAELLDNATHFSPPDSHVMISSDLAADGSVAIEIADRGVGMTEAELIEANERLAAPPVVDVSVSRRMGLFVVGRLAGRHGIEVRLRRGEGGVGVWASVIMPPRLVRVALETAEPAGEAVSAPRAAASELAETNGSTRNGTAALAASRNGTPVPRPDIPNVNPDVDPACGSQINGSQTNGSQINGSQTNGSQTNGNGSQPVSPLAPNDRPGDSEPAQRIGKLSASALSPPAPPGPPASPPADGSVDAPNAGSGADLFRPARATVTGPVGPGHRVTLQHSTPIFDDVASAWFKEHEAVPVRWTAPSVRGSTPASRDVPTRDVRSPDAPLPDAPLPDASLPDASPARPASEKVVQPASAKVAQSAKAGSPPLMRRQPGKALAESSSGNVSEPRSSGQPVPALSTTLPADSPAQDWGAADEGWRAAEALATPVSAEFTPRGLPRRQPRALLVPGAAGGPEPTSAPVRSAESIRGRLASYQQGIREGRQVRGNLGQEADGSPAEQQDGEETT
jgi:Histidine kinase-, DNA gyrase B-, and HSP90-like ATPase